MRSIRVLLIGLAGASGTGCFAARPSAPESFLCQAARNSVQQPIRCCDDKTFIRVTRRHADEAWAQICGASHRQFSHAYHDGFVEGFIDYVEAGGTGEPPYLPPFRYRLTKYRSADGLAVIEDWYAGFRHGAAMARESGLRELNYVPLPGPAIPGDARSPSPWAEPIPVPQWEGGRSPWDQPGLLPAPRPVPATPDSLPTAPQPRPVPGMPGPTSGVPGRGGPANPRPTPDLSLPLTIPAPGLASQPASTPRSVTPASGDDRWQPAAPRVNPAPGTGPQ
jgi:hypothetical protein